MDQGLLADCIERAKRGDAEAFYQAFSQYEQLIYKVAYTYLLNRQDALDAVQDTAYLSYKNIKSLREPANFKAWLCKIAANKSIDIIKQRHPTAELDTALNIADPVSAQTSQMEFVDLLRNLSEHEKNILLLKLYFDYTFDMIASEKGESVNTVKTTYYRAIEKLKIREGVV